MNHISPYGGVFPMWLSSHSLAAGGDGPGDQVPELWHDTFKDGLKAACLKMFKGKINPQIIPNPGFFFFNHIFSPFHFILGWSQLKHLSQVPADSFVCTDHWSEGGSGCLWMDGLDAYSTVTPRKQMKHHLYTVFLVGFYTGLYFLVAENYGL